jgi:hypothetical protein
MFRIVQFSIPFHSAINLSESIRFRNFYDAAGPHHGDDKEYVSVPMATTQKEFFICEQLLRGLVGHIIRDITSKYSLLRTRAPRAYDYEYVIEIGRMDGEFGEERIVAIPKSKVEYQSGRYSSGLYTPISCA